MKETETILSVHGIDKSFQGVHALRNVEFQLKRGEVHALIGENGAGKSTLMKILLGMHQADNGEIIYKGKTVKFKNPNHALSNGISMIHQEISLVPTLSVSENIWLGREKKFCDASIYIRSKKRDAATRELLQELGIDLKPGSIISVLSIAHMQLVEIARAVSYNSDIIIMDEPTSALTDKEVELLYTIIRNLSKKGVAIVFISHKLEEIFEICDTITVMRDGQYICRKASSEITQDELIKLIVGRELSEMFPKLPAKIGEPVLEVRDLCGEQFENVSFTVHSGEILGFSGLMGAGRTEVMRAIFGIDPIQAGEVHLNGKQIKVRSPKGAIDHGLAMVTEDRLRLGSIYALSVEKNISLAYLRRITNKFTIVNRKKEDKDCLDMIEQMEIKVASAEQKINSLSGGNQQKAIISRWLLTKPKVLILDEPTRGIDVGSKSEIHRTISKLAQQGIAIILISSELPEVMGMSDRIMVMREGKLVCECSREEATQEKLIAHSFGNVEDK
ncbi:MAG: sugar ABC transporter ATP-binding protein [Lachnospiraceae bacterium]|nr:sugar ABC transporter ATP-binding protein [Lachnospiraceae bacterium]